MNTTVQFRVTSKDPPKVELSDAGLYVRFQTEPIARTVIQNEWPHIAVDLDANDEVIGIEVVPAPSGFSINSIKNIVATAKVGGLPRYKDGDVQIENLSAA
jgi:uncharacterized protein YuzE